MSSWKAPQRSKSQGPCQHVKKRRLAAGIESLEERVLMSADGLALNYDAGAAFVSPLWFAQLGQSSASQANAGIFSFDDAIGSIEWKGAAVDVYMDEWIVQLTRETSQQINTFVDVVGLFDNSSFGIEVIGGLGLEGQLLVRANGASSDEIQQWFSKQSSISYFEPNSLLPLNQTTNDPSYAQLWGLNNTGQSINGQTGVADADIDAPEAWDLTTGSSNVVVGVIDSGVDYTHPDLAANMWRNPGEIAGNGVDDDGNGFIDDVYGYDFVNNDGNPMDDHGHGTHVAGTIGGVGNNGSGVAGVNWSTSIMALKFLSSGGSGSLYDAVRAVNYATMMRNTYGVNVRMTNNSWGGGGYQQSLHDAIYAHGQAGILFIAAAGNDGSNNDQTPSFPSGYNLSNVIAVAATDNRDALASFSNYGATTVDLAAPGVSILSARMGGGYQYMSGTSMAAPHVSGVAALCWSLDPTATIQQVRDAILNGVDQVASLTGKVLTAGRLNARGALEQMGMHVVGSTPAAGAAVSAPPTNFTIDFSHNFDPATVQASDLRVNGIAANSYTIVDANTIRFTYAASPVTAQGAQTMQIASGAIGRAGGGGALTAWQSTFNYDQTAMTVVATTPSANQTVTSNPTSITITLNEAVAAGSVSAAGLVLSQGTVTGATLVNATTVRYTVSLPTFSGTVSYTLAAGALRDLYGNASVAYTGQFTVNDPTVLSYAANGLPMAIPDLSTIVSAISVSEAFTILDLDIQLTINHTWNDDLDVYLVAPNGTRIQLFTDVGGNGQGFVGTILDDQATTSIVNGTAPFNGRYRPEGSLSVVNGMSTAGVWKLEVSDDYQYDTGTLASWSLQFRVARPPIVAAIADQTMSHTVDKLQLQVSASSPIGSPLTYSVTAVGLSGNPTYDLDQQLGLWAEPARVANNYYRNTAGHGEKWLRGANDTVFWLMPNGELRKWTGNTSVGPWVGNPANMPLIATFDASYYADPSKLWNAPPTEVPMTASISGAGWLTVDPPAGFVGQIRVTVNVSDGVATSSQAFTLNVTNQSVVVAPIADQTIPHGGQLVLQVSASDNDGDSLTYSATASGTLIGQTHEVAQQFSLWADAGRVANNYYRNTAGHGEKWLLGANNTVFWLMPNGELRQWTGNTSVGPWVGNPSTMPLVATLDTSYYADPTRLWTPQSTSMPVAASINGSGQLTVTPPAGFIGEIRVSVNVSDGMSTSTQSFTLNVTNQAVTLAPIADQTISHRTNALQLQLAVNNPDGDPLTYSATAVGLAGNPAYDLDQQLGLWAEPARVVNNYYRNTAGHGEKWLRGANSTVYWLMPNGELRQWTGNTSVGPWVGNPANMPLIATFDASFYADPSKLWNAQATQVAVGASVDAAGLLTVDPPAGFVGTVRVSVSVSDGVSSDTQTFALNVVNQAATITPIANQTIAQGGQLALQVWATDPDGDPLTYSATAVGLASNLAYDLDQQLGLWADPARVANNYYRNTAGHGEKWLLGANSTVYWMMPNGELRKWTGNTSVGPWVGNPSAMPLIATFDASFYADPSKLWNAQPTSVAISSAISAAGWLTVTPPGDFVGQVRVSVTVSDGAASETRTFMLGVGTAAQSMATTAAMEPIAVAPLPAAPAVAVSPMSPDPAAFQALLARSLNVQPVASSFAHTLAVGLSSSSVSRTDSVAAAEAGLRASTMAASPLRTFVSPTAFARRTEVSETRTLSPLATARAMPSASFRSLADSVFERLDAIEAALMRFDAESEADAEAAPQ